jgi:hypothetical protein
VKKRRHQIQKRPRRTSEYLAQELQKLNDPALTPLIRRAWAGYYDDFRSPLAMPTVQLYKDLLDAGHTETAQRVVHGDFDATPAEARAWMRREGRALLRKMIEGQ